MYLFRCSEAIQNRSKLQNVINSELRLFRRIQKFTETVRSEIWILGIHAREWIANAVATYIIRELVENYEENKDIVDNLNIHVLPMANPDGYEYSRSSVRGFLYRHFPPYNNIAITVFKKYWC